MSTKIGVGSSMDLDPKKAANEAVKEAFKKAGTEKCDFVFLFSAVGYEQEEILKEVRALTNNAPLSGCSGEGIISQDGSSEKPYGLGVMVFSSDEVKFYNYLGRNLKSDSKSAGEEVGKAIKTANIKDPVALILLPDGLTCNMKQIFAGIKNIIGADTPCIGGTSGDNWKFAKTYQYHNDQVLSDAVSAVLISGNVKLEAGVSHGCVPIGMEKKITKAEGNRIYEIDNRPAYDVLTEYLAPGEAKDFAKAMAYFAIGEPVSKEIEGLYDKYMVRACMSRDEKDNSITIPTEMPVGTTMQLMRRDPETIVKRAKETAEKIKQRIGEKKPKFILHFDCAGRGKILFGVEEKTREPIEAMQKVIGKDIPWLGFFTFGEIAPVNNKNYFHNYTVALCVIY